MRLQGNNRHPFFSSLTWKHGELSLPNRFLETGFSTQNCTDWIIDEIPQSGSYSLQGVFFAKCFLLHCNMKTRVYKKIVLQEDQHISLLILTPAHTHIYFENCELTQILSITQNLV